MLCATAWEFGGGEGVEANSPAMWCDPDLWEPVGKGQNPWHQT